MVIRLRWQEKVVISIVAMLFIFSKGVSQEHRAGNDILHKKIVLKDSFLPFEEVLHQLSVQTKLYFIYSSNAVVADKTVTIDFNQKSLKEVFVSLENQMNVSFRKEGNYVIVKKGAMAVESSTRATVNPPPTFNRASRNVATFASAEPIQSFQKRTIREYPFTIPYHTLQKNLLECPSDLSGIDTSTFKKHPLQITNPRRIPQFFTSIRMIANEYSGGVEIHAGIPSLYAVLNGGLMKDGYFRYGYGLGTSINIKSNLTFQPIYTFATLKREEDYVLDYAANIVIADGLKLTGYHHQLKFIFQYKLSPRVRVHLGPTFNFLKTNYAYEQAKTLLYDVTTVVASPPINQRYAAPTVGIRRSVYVVSAPADGYSLKSWSGFEAGISYLIKFPRH